MGESIKHMQLVCKCMGIVKQIIPFEKHCFISVDMPDSNNKPPVIFEGFIPDVYYSDSNLLIIGEAKTSNDFSTHHSINQYKAFINYSLIYPGNTYFIVAVPWTDCRAVRNIIRKIIREDFNNKIVTLIVDDLGRVHRL